MGMEKKEDINGDVRHVKLPVGWEGLSLKTHEGRLLVSEVPKACFSSKNFESSGAQPQVAGVFEGDEIVSVNGEPAASVEKKILAEGDPWNACSSSKPRHPVGSKGKFDSPPCVACDFQRRRKALGLDVALQMWLRAVKRDIRISLAVRSSGIQIADLPGTSDDSFLAKLKASGGDKVVSSVVELKESSSGGKLSKMKSLDQLTKENQAQKLVQKEVKKGKGKGKGKGKSKRPTGPHLPRTRISTEPLKGQVLEWKTKFGWIKPESPIDHPLFDKHRGKIYINVIDLLNRYSLDPGDTCEFQLFSDASGLGAEECWVGGDDDQDWSQWNDEGEWEDEEGDAAMEAQYV